MSRWSLPNPIIGSQLLSAGTVVVRYPQFRDGRDWVKLRRSNRQFLEPWEPGITQWDKYHCHKTWRRTVRGLYRLRFPPSRQMFIIEYQQQFVGQISLSNITYGALYSAQCGYWIEHHAWNRGIATAALEITIKHAFTGLGLHRLEATVQAHNYSSIAVLEKNSFFYEGTLHQYMHIGGEWKDHLLFARISPPHARSAFDEES